MQTINKIIDELDDIIYNYQAKRYCRKHYKEMMEMYRTDMLQLKTKQDQIEKLQLKVQQLKEKLKCSK